MFGVIVCIRIASNRDIIDAAMTDLFTPQNRYRAITGTHRRRWNYPENKLLQLLSINKPMNTNQEIMQCGRSWYVLKLTKANATQRKRDARRKQKRKRKRVLSVRCENDELCCWVSVWYINKNTVRSTSHDLLLVGQSVDSVWLSSLAVSLAHSLASLASRIVANENHVPTVAFKVI